MYAQLAPGVVQISFSIFAETEMYRKQFFLPVFTLLVLVFPLSAGASTLAYWRFEGPLDANIVSAADQISGKILTALPGASVDPAATLTYGEPAPFVGLNSSASFYNPIPNASNNTGICMMAPDDDQLDLAGAAGVTIEAFVKPSEIRQAVIVRDYDYNENNHGYWVDIENSDQYTFHIGDGSTYANVSSGEGTLTLDQWQHVAATWDGTTMRIYVDGEEKNSVPYTAGLKDNPGAFSIGGIVRWSGAASRSTEGQYYNGLIDEVRISDAALSPSQFLNSFDVPIVGFESDESQTIENAGTAEISIQISSESPYAVTVDYQVAAGSADGGGVDYTLANGTLTFEPNQTTPETIDVQITDDTLPEDNETIVLTLTNPVNAIIGSKSKHTLTIVDDDTIPTVEFEKTSSENPEFVTPANITVKLSNVYKDPVTVYCRITGGTADGHGVDYDWTAQPLVFNPYQLTKDISLDIVFDAVYEVDETIELTLYNATNALLGANTQHTYTILDSFVNSVGMKFVSIQPGTFTMGSENGDFDEKPLHNVTISQPFLMSVYEVTNAQYEQFDPDHALIDRQGFSDEPNEAVIFVSWEDANAFCTWLSQREGLPYRLPTEAEWEYACRAGTTTEYNTGDTCLADKNQVNTKGPHPISLTVGNGPANAWGLYDMHGNVEEWCYDWYGPYEPYDQIDPVGRVCTDVKVTRGGSHSTPVYYLRSANRMGTIPQDKHWLIGFRVVIGDLPDTEPLPEPPLQQYQTNVSQTIPPDINDGPDPDTPYFSGPQRYVWIPPELDGGPLYHNHNHVPGIVECPNGDLLAVWYSTISEKGRYLAIAASRLRYGTDQWEDASLFWDNPDRNDHAPQIWLDEQTGTLYHFNGLGDAYSWAALATVMRTSTDNGVTWSKPHLIIPEHGYRHMPIESVFRATNGDIILPCDAVPGGSGGTAIWISPDDGLNWYDPPDFCRRWNRCLDCRNPRRYC